MTRPYLTFFHFVLICLVILYSTSSLAQPSVQTNQNTNGHIKFQFDNATGISIAPASSTAVAGTSCAAGSVEPAEAGALRYNDKLKNLEFCNGSVWVPAGKSMVCPTGQFATTDNTGKAMCVSLVCPKGEMITRDAVTGLFECVGIKSNMDCIRRVQDFPGAASGTYTCPTGYLVLNSSCQRYKTNEISGTNCENVDNGMFNGEFISADRRSVTCKNESNQQAGRGPRVMAVCCK